MLDLGHLCMGAPMPVPGQYVMGIIIIAGAINSISPEPDQCQIRHLASPPPGSFRALSMQIYICATHTYIVQPASPVLERTRTDSRRHFAPQQPLSSIELRRQASCSRCAYAFHSNICALLVSNFDHFPALVWWGICLSDRRILSSPHTHASQALICYFRLPHHPVARLMPNGYVVQS